jgi:hypothetical protein
VYVFNSGEITANAKEQLLNELGRERYSENVHFLDGERLEALNEWATLQSDANARTRLIGLRSALRFIIATLDEYQLEGKPGSQPIFIQGKAERVSELRRPAARVAIRALAEVARHRRNAEVTVQSSTRYRPAREECTHAKTTCAGRADAYHRSLPKN